MRAGVDDTSGRGAGSGDGSGTPDAGSGDGSGTDAESSDGSGTDTGWGDGFLLATPHSTTGIAPSQLLFGKLPQLESEKHTEFDQEVKRRDELTKEKMKCYADKKARAQLTEMRVGDTVLIQQRRNKKFTTKFDTSPLKVVKVEETTVTAVRNEKYYTHNISHFKKVPATCT